MLRAFLYWVILILAIIIPAGTQARDTTPLPATDQSPVSLIFGLPALGSARILPQGRSRASVSYEVSNYMFYDRRATEELVLDGETRRATFVFAFGAAGAEWGVEIPYLSHSGGTLDAFIRRWHDTFGQRQGGRDETPDNRLIYNYTRNGATLLDVTQPSEGVGDIRLFGGWELSTDNAMGLALRASLKLPTGEPEALRGSGAADLAVWLSAACSTAGCPGRWNWNAGGGVLWLGQGDVLPEQQRRLAAFASAGVGWTYWAPVTLKAALYGHTPFYRDSEFSPLTAASMQLILGGTWTISPRATLEVALTEDIRVYTAPDVGILINLRADF